MPARHRRPQLYTTRGSLQHSTPHPRALSEQGREGADGGARSELANRGVGTGFCRGRTRITRVSFGARRGFNQRGAWGVRERTHAPAPVHTQPPRVKRAST